MGRAAEGDDLIVENSGAFAALPSDDLDGAVGPYLGASLVFLLVAILACVVPVGRALRVDPLIALRAE